MRVRKALVLPPSDDGPHPPTDRHHGHRPDGANVAMVTSFGATDLTGFKVITDELVAA